MKTTIEDMQDALKKTKKLHYKTMETIAHEIISSYENNGKCIIFGNGGSYADALHFAGELEGAYLNRKRPALAALVPANTAAMTAIANDFQYDNIFYRFVDANANPGDVVIGISTSGNSPNVVSALGLARKKNAKTVAFTGENGGKCREHADLLLNVPSDFTPCIQIAHSAAYHIICEIIESEMFGK